jgi:hypothetical protein
MTAMPRGLRPLMVGTDVAMLGYWTLMLAAAAGIVDLPPEAMYRNYANPLVVAWNWSFFPLDVAFAIAGLRAARLARRGDPRWRGWATVSLTLTMCAGGMAIAFWALTGDIDPSWWLPNLFLLLWPLAFLPRLMEGAR